MTKLFLDTSIIIEYFRKNSKVIELVNDESKLMVSDCVVLSELYEGVFLSKDKYRAENILKQFFNGLDKIYTLDKEIAETFGRIRSDLRKKGKMIEDTDIFIAATCIVNNLTLVTLNKKHFSRIKNLRILPVSRK